MYRNIAGIAIFLGFMLFGSFMRQTLPKDSIVRGMFVRNRPLVSYGVYAPRFNSYAAAKAHCPNDIVNHENSRNGVWDWGMGRIYYEVPSNDFVCSSDAMAPDPNYRGTEGDWSFTNILLHSHRH